MTQDRKPGEAAGAAGCISTAVIAVGLVVYFWASIPILNDESLTVGSWLLTGVVVTGGGLGIMFVAVGVGLGCQAVARWLTGRKKDRP